jgi:lysozyme
MNFENLKNTLVRHEGLSLRLYQCTSNANTIGVGHNLDAKGISEAVADLMLEEDIEDAVKDLKRNIEGFQELPNEIQEALVNLCFNMGIARLLQFRKTLAYIYEGKYLKAANELLDSRYASQVGYRAVEIAQLIRSAGHVQSTDSPHH